MHDQEGRRRLLILGGAWPHTKENKEAANVVAHQITREFALSKYFEIIFLFVSHLSVPIPKGGEKDIDELKQLGVKVFDQIYIKKTSLVSHNRIKRFLYYLKDPRRLMSGWGQEDLIYKVIGDYKPDVLLTIWSEYGYRLGDSFDCLKYNYYGNIDHKVRKASQLIEKLIGKKFSFSRKLYNLVMNPLYKKGHLKIMRNFNWVFNVAKNDAEYYSSHGVPSSYIQMTWNGNVISNWEKIRNENEKISPLKIIGSVGNQTCTGNSLAFIALCNEILPALEKKLGVGNFEIHLFGGGKPRYHEITKMISHKSIINRGFVDDLESEILSAPVVLIPHCFYQFKVSHTRFLHSWSLGSPVVAFNDTKVSMPEINHGENALLGANGEEIAHHIVLLANDVKLRRKLGLGGIRTLNNQFSSTNVSNKIKNKIMEDLG